MMAPWKAASTEGKPNNVANMAVLRQLRMMGVKIQPVLGLG
jgi:hypothetical protein